MKRSIPFVCLLLSLFATAQKRAFDLGDLVHSAFIPDEKLSTYVTRIGFKANKLIELDPEQPQFINRHNKEKIIRFLTRHNTQEGATVAFETSSAQEYSLLKQDLLNHQFTRITGTPAEREEFQKENIIITAYSPNGSDTNYRIRIDQKAMPLPTELVYAEDLLTINSHENLVAIYGRQHVRKDSFYFSEKDFTTCSVLFPNTFSQAVFLWEDKYNFRNTSFIIIGDRWDQNQAFLNTQGAAQNKWKSRSGVYIGMSLNEVVKVNNHHIELFGWSSENPGYAAMNNRGKLDFRRVGLQFLCLDCKEDKYYTKTNLIGSETLLRNQGRVYINKMILVPERNILQE
jgi:hypothetical protein